MSAKSPLSVSHMRAADGGTIKKPIMVLPGGKSQERRASRFSFQRNQQNRRGVFGVQGTPCPSESPVHLTHFCGRWYGVLKCAPRENVCNYRNTRRKTTENDIIRERGEQNEDDNSQWKSREKWRL